MNLTYALAVISIFLLIIFHENKYIVYFSVATLLSSVVYNVHIRNKKKKDTNEAIRQIFINKRK